MTPRFPEKLWNLINECKSGAIGWVKEGNVIFIDQTKFESEVLGKCGDFCKTNNFDSFIRQLNLYGFQKCSRQKDVHHYKHPYFVRGKKELSLNLKRKYKTHNLSANTKIPNRQYAAKKCTKTTSLNRAAPTDHSYPNVIKEQFQNSIRLHRNAIPSPSSVPVPSYWFGSPFDAANKAFAEKHFGRQGSSSAIKQEGDDDAEDGSSNAFWANTTKQWLRSPLDYANQMFGKSGSEELDSEKESDGCQEGSFWGNPAAGQRVVFVPVPMPANFGIFPGFYTDTLDASFGNDARSSSRDGK